jgi:hypothetical protein
MNSDQIKTFQMAKNAAINNLNYIINNLRDSGGNINKIDSNIYQAVKSYISSKFGENKNDIAKLTNQLGKIVNQLNNLNPNSNVFSEDEDKGYYGLAFPAVGNFLIALNFELIQDKKSDECFSFSGVLIHEVSHNFFVLNTEDIKYTAFESRELSNKVKVANATNWEYFYNQSTKLLREKENE